MTHDDHEYDSECADCRAEMEASYREAMATYPAERAYRESMALARQDLDMADASESELMTGILLRLK